VSLHVVKHLLVVGASILPGNQECNGILALFAKAPPNNNKEIILIANSFIYGAKVKI